LDYALFLPLWMTLDGLPKPGFLPRGLVPFWETAAVPWILYFLFLEGWWGCSLGKRSLGLRVVTVGGEKPGLARTALRTLLFYSIVSLPGCLVVLLMKPSFGAGVVLVGSAIAGVALVAAPMRRRNGFRGLHDLVS